MVVCSSVQLGPFKAISALVCSHTSSRVQRRGLQAHWYDSIDINQLLTHRLVPAFAISYFDRDCWHHHRRGPPQNSFCVEIYVYQAIFELHMCHLYFVRYHRCSDLFQSLSRLEHSTLLVRLSRWTGQLKTDLPYDYLGRWQVSVFLERLTARPRSCVGSQLRGLQPELYLG